MAGLISLNFAGTSLEQTSKTVGEIVTAISRPVSGTQNPIGSGALDAYHMALDWLLESKWEYYHFRAASFQTIPGTADYAIPTRCNAVYNLRVVTGNPRPLFPIEKGLYDRVVYDQSATGTSVWYDLSKMHTGTLLTLHPTPDVVETYEMDIYRDPAKDTDLAVVPDIATWMERAIILQGQGLVTKWRGGQGALADSLLQWSERAKQGALIRDRGGLPDEETALVPYAIHGMQTWPWNHPMRDLLEDY